MSPRVHWIITIIVAAAAIAGWQQYNREHSRLRALQQQEQTRAAAVAAIADQYDAGIFGSVEGSRVIVRLPEERPTADGTAIVYEDHEYRINNDTKVQRITPTAGQYEDAQMSDLKEGDRVAINTTNNGTIITLYIIE